MFSNKQKKKTKKKRKKVEETFLIEMKKTAYSTPVEPKYASFNLSFILSHVLKMHRIC